MAILGWHGSVTLYREWPDSAELQSADFEEAGGMWRLPLDDTGWWSGDRVLLEAPGGLPFDLNGDGYADCPMGHRMYGPIDVAGPCTLHRVDDAAPMYRLDSEQFYDSEATTGLTTSAELYVRRDQLDRVSFYASAFEAVNGGTTGLVPMKPVAFGAMIMTAAWDDTDGWKQVCNLQGFAIDIDPSNLDTAAIGEEFGSYVRGIVRGAGSISGQMSNKYVEHTTNTARLAKLALLTRKGAQALARFQLSPGDIEDCAPDPPLFFESTIMLGRTTVQLSFDAAVTLQSEFVMTTEPKLIMDYGDPVLPP